MNCTLPATLPAGIDQIAALFVMERGPYFGLDGVDPWPESRDARLYRGPWPVVAHPDCARWGKLWAGTTPTNPVRRELGDDGGCFAFALEAIQRWGGVLEHPAHSRAWATFGLKAPSRPDCWTVACHDRALWTCVVEQGWYGHKARKPTWLLACRTDLPSLRWGRSPQQTDRLREGQSEEERRRAIRTGIVQRMSARQRAATPDAFRDLLISLARSVKQR